MSSNQKQNGKTKYWTQKLHVLPDEELEEPPENEFILENGHLNENGIITENGLHPGSFETYKKVKRGWFELDMSGMGLKKLCLEIKLYNHITALYLNNNKLASLPDEIFTELRSLSTLDLSYNCLTHLPSAFGNLIYLEKLSLHQNRINELPLEMGHLFRLKELDIDGNPISSPPASVVQCGTESIISFLRDRMPMGPPPPERRFISYVEPSVLPPEKERFKIFSYNVLAESYARFIMIHSISNTLLTHYHSADRYLYCPCWALDWHYRKKKILQEILSYDSDIICLQEVEAGQYKDYFQPEMQKAGYLGILVPKSRARTMEDWSTVDGCAMFYKKNRFTVVEEHAIEFQSIAMHKHKEFGEDPEAFSRVITKDNVAMAVIFQFKDTDSQQSNGRNGSKFSKPRYLLVSNTHIHWNPEHKDVKLIQVQLLLEQLTLLTSLKSKWYKIPMVLSGDFNSAVDSGPYELLSTGRLKPRHDDLQTFNYGTYTSVGMSHPLQLSSSYAPLGEPPFTNYTGDFVGVLDYLWFSSETLGVSKVLQPIDEETVRNTRLPNAYMPSDHISILSEFFFKRK